MLTINILLPLLVACVGAIVFLLCTPSSTRVADIKELAKHMWWTGLLVTLFVFATTHVRF